MSHHTVRFFFCGILVVLALVVPRQAPLMAVDAARAPAALPPGVMVLVVPGAPRLRLPTADGVLFRYGSIALHPEGAAYIQPAFEQQMRSLRSTILASAARHNRRPATGLSDEEFAVFMAAQLYYENNAVLRQRGEIARMITPVYQEAQNVVNQIGFGDYTVWPANLRPSVARSLLLGELPYIDEDDRPAALTIPITIVGSALQPAMQEQGDWQPSLSAVAAEIVRPRLAVEYLAANFEVASYRAELDRAPISWITFTAWHNQGVVSAAAISEHSQLASVLPEVASYLPAAMRLIYIPEPAPWTRTPQPR